MTRTLALLWIIVASLCLCQESQAHDPQLSGLKLIWDADGVTASVITHASKLGAGDVEASIRRRLKLRLDGQDFRPAASTCRRDRANDLVMWQARQSGAFSRLQVLARLYPEDTTSRLLVTVFRDGRAVQEAILDSSHASVALGDASAPIRSAQTVRRFLAQGVEHIFGGIDHVCFVLGLLLLGGSLRQLLRTVTAFTFAHSITLSLAATGVCAPSPRLVEPLIALSIVAVAAENWLWCRREGRGEIPPDRRPLLALGFGLIHGFGFAGALAEVGLPREALGLALASFNIGVELGQAAIVLTLAPLLAWLASTRLQRRGVVLLGSVPTALAGAFWFFHRVLGYG